MIYYHLTVKRWRKLTSSSDSWDASDHWPIESVTSVMSTNNKKAELPQKWPRDAPYAWVPWKFSTMSTPRLLLPKFLMGFCSDRSCECANKIWLKFAVRRTDVTTCNCNTALCTKVHRAVKTINCSFTCLVLLLLAVLRLHVVCLSVCDVGGSGSHRLEILETNCTDT